MHQGNYVQLTLPFLLQYWLALIAAEGIAKRKKREAEVENILSQISY